MILGSGLLTSSWPKASDWLIRDEFTDTVAAGSVDGTAATPGPGTRAVTDTESKISVGSGALALAGGKASPAFGDPSLWFSAMSWVDGIALIGKFTTTSGTIVYGLGVNTTGAPVYGMYYDNNGTIFARNGATVAVASWTVGSGTNKFVLAGGDGYLHHFIETSGQWTLLWTAPVAVAATVYPGASNYNCICSTDYLRAIQLPAPFDTDTGLATDTHSGSVAAGTTFTHEANALIEATITTVPSADNLDIIFRQQDASNYWICRVNSSGDISLQEVVAGTPTQRGVAAGVVSNGHRVVVIADGTTIRIFSNNTLRITYSSASSSVTATAGEVDALGTGGAVSDLKTWPRTLSGTAASILDKVSA